VFERHHKTGQGVFATMRTVRESEDVPRFASLSITDVKISSSKAVLCDVWHEVFGCPNDPDSSIRHTASDSLSWVSL
jgi:hypothetical protein